MHDYFSEKNKIKKVPTNGGKNYGKSFIKTKYKVTVSCTCKKTIEKKPSNHPQL